MSFEVLPIVTAPGREVLITWREYRELVGTVSAKVCRVSGHGTICRLFVKAGWRRERGGSALVSQAVAELRAAGCHRCFVLLPALSQRDEVFSFFESCGFGRIPGSEFDPPVGSLVMMREIEGGGE
jgi:N-acetylglutamate synthase-like GNAT family acetyltransferase|tara:strand:- start:11736 stop:12113 length:378 start_codon:yes stop_codon:yes gene_type:complete